jgi:hypothetical protein
VEGAVTDREVENEVAKKQQFEEAVQCGARISLSANEEKKKKGSSTPELVPPRLHHILAPGQICKRHTNCARSLDRSFPRFGPVSLVALHACMHAQRCVFFFFLYSHNLDIYIKDLAEFRYKLHTKVEFSFKHPFMFLANIREP